MGHGRPHALRSLVMLWAAWIILLYSYQYLASLRLDLVRPDLALKWTQQETTIPIQDESPYLLDPFLNRQVAWDSEYYLSIALAGYDDPRMQPLPASAPAPAPLNYAFFPLYPFLIRILLIPLRVTSLGPVAAATLAGVIVSLLGTLAGMIALWDMTREELGEDAGIRTAFYLLIFPTGFILAQVYTEGLFIGLAFGSLALLKRKLWLQASLLGLFAALTRAQGAVLALPLAIEWLRTIDRQGPLRPQLTWRFFEQGLLTLAPLLAFFGWQMTRTGQLGVMVQDQYFGRGLLLLSRSIVSWFSGLLYALGNTQALSYFALEVFGLGLGTVAGLAVLRRYPAAAAFSLALVLLSVFSGSAQGMIRFMLVLPAIYLFLSRLGQHVIFDRVWTIASLLIMGLLALLFSFDMWVG